MNSARLQELSNDLQKILQEGSNAINLQNAAYDDATKELVNLKELISDPAHILGSDRTKHGEIAELLDVYISRANDVVAQRTATATFDGVPRTGAADYIMNGIEVQSKFINGTNNTLKHVLYHMENYTYFGRDGSCYQIPKDQFEIVSKIVNGEQIQGLTLNSQIAIQNKVIEIEQITGKNFTDVVKPSISTYSEVQSGIVFRTVDGHDHNIILENQKRIETIKEDHRNKERIAYSEHQPSLSEAGQAGAIGAVIALAMSFTLGIREKIKKGKKITEFTNDDWKEIGLDTAKASARGGITGAALYGLTNLTDLSSPVSAALISSTFGIASVYRRYKNKEITISDLYEETQLICVDSSIVALGATIGSIAIPIPILGALVGSTMATVSNDYLKKWLSEEEQKEIQRLYKDYTDYTDELNKTLKELISSVNKKYKELSGIVGIAFNYEIDIFIRLDASICFSTEMGVPTNKIIRDKSALNKYLGY